MAGSTGTGATDADSTTATRDPAHEAGAVVDLREFDQGAPTGSAHAPSPGATHAPSSGATHAPSSGATRGPASHALAARAPVGAAEAPSAPTPGRQPGPAPEIAASTDGERVPHGWVIPALVAFVCIVLVASVAVAASRGWQARAEAELAPVRAAAQRTVSDAIRARYGAWPVPGQEQALPTEPNAVSVDVWLSGPVPDGTMRSCEVRTGGSLTDVAILCADRNGRQVPR